MTKEANRKLAAIMFADIVSYSRMMGANEKEALKIVADFDSISIPIVEKFNGVLIKKNGDEIFCEFSSAKNAVDASVEIQNKLASYNDSRPKDFKLEVRIGIHIGDVVKKDNDIFGDGVNVAARIQPLAAPGGICVSGAVNDALSSHPNYNIVSKGKQELKHIVQQHSIFDLKTGHERKIANNKARPSLSSSLKKPIYFIPLFCFLLIISLLVYSSIFNNKRKIENIYLDITSSNTYIDSLFVDYGYNTVRYIPKQDYEITSINDSLRNIILKNIYQDLSKHYVSLNLNFEASFKDEERQMLNTLLYLKVPMDKRNDQSFENTKQIMNDIGEMISGRLNANKSHKPDVLIRGFVYNVLDKKDNSNYLTHEFSVSFGKALDEGIETRTWSSTDTKFSNSKTGVDSLINSILDKSIEYLDEAIFSDEGEDNAVLGRIIEVLDGDMVKIKQKASSPIKRNMTLKTFRVYDWAQGGAEIAIEDLSIMIDYLNKAINDNSMLYEFWQNDDKFNSYDYDEIMIVDKIKENIKMLTNYRASIQSKLDDNSFYENTTSHNDSFSYTLEVVDVIDDIVIAKIIDTDKPIGSFKYRVEDLVILKQ